MSSIKDKMKKVSNPTAQVCIEVVLLLVELVGCVCKNGKRVKRIEISIGIQKIEYFNILAY